MGCRSTSLASMCAGRRRVAVLLAAAFGCRFDARALAEEKNGVAPNTVSLPSGPGSIEGLGESFQPMLHTGTANYTFAIALPPGTAGHAPRLVLRYDGGFGNGPLGFGWKLGPSEVRRQTERGVP